MYLELYIFFFQISKNRYNGNLGIMPLEFNKESLSFTKDLNTS